MNPSRTSRARVALIPVSLNLLFQFFFRNAYNGCEIIFNSMPVISMRASKVHKFRSIYPHEFDNTVILVHNIIHTGAKLRDFYIFVAAIVGTFAITVAFSKALRILSNESNQDLSRVVLDALGSFLATSPKATVNKLPVKILQFSLVVFSIVFSIFASAFLFGLLLTRNKFNNIDRLHDLAKSNLQIFITIQLNETIDQWSQNLE